MNFHLTFIFISLFLFFQQFQNLNYTPANIAVENYSTPVSDPVVGLNLGNQAPEISMKSPQGSAIKLSALRGKLVLVDFWASWCGPCRKENPYVVKAYTSYKDKKFKGGEGFTIYSVSLDMDLGAWKKGIEKDGLNWENHVSDLQGWNSEAALRYNVNGIPFNLLINDKGVIIQKNLRGEDLLLTLERLSTQ